MFTLKELEEDASLLLDLKEDVREECSSLGEVTNVVLYDVSFPPGRAVGPTFTLTFSSIERRGWYHDCQIP